MSYFDEAPERLSRYFRKGQYDLYDGVFVQQNAELSVTDILLSVALNSQLDTRNKIWHVWRKKSTIEEALAKVSSAIKLEDEEVPWKKLHVLFNTFCQIKYAKEAVTTKILHKKRPNLIPIYDRYVWSHFKSRIDRKLWTKGGARFLVEYTQVFRQELLDNKEAICEAQSFTSANNWSISLVRILEVLIWIEYEPTGYYRKSNLEVD